ncbi:MAG: glutamate--tRNA ligase [Euryarchaeota archaeon]|nr:glutamate--tRNA ligase [Euryarchaeota archaeon]MBT5183881.1 glutamate--tRNA ligase [Euryarchaeota archaeon]
MEWQPDQAITDLIRHLALQNSLQYSGKGQAGSVISRIMGSRADLRPYGKHIAPLVAKAVAEANSKAETDGLDSITAILEAEAPELLERKIQKRREGLPELPNLDGRKPVLRFAPNPNGHLSFGHSRGLVINGQYAKELGGELILRFDDTDTTVKPPMMAAYDSIPKQQEWLCGFPAHRIVIASERMEFYHDHARQMLEGGFGYVCTCSGDDFKEHRVAMTKCPCRDNEISTNLEKWGLMNDPAAYQPGDAVLRVKTDMTLKNPALRDWPAARIQINPHPRVGNKWRVWPLLDFQSAVEDHLQGVTHIIRGKDLMDSTRKQTLLYAHFGWTYPDTIYWGRVKVHEFGVFSTSQMRRDIDAGLFSDWDDPRLPTLAALSRRGIKPDALRAFWIELGLTQKDIAVPLSTLYSHNTKAIDSTSPRLAFIRNPVPLVLTGNLPRKGSITSHPDTDMPTRDYSIDEGVWIEKEDSGKSIRLKDLCDVDKDGNVESIDRSDKRGIIHWVAGGKPSKLTIAAGQDLLVVEGILEDNNHPIGTIVQLERIGYGIVEEDGLLMVHD